MSQAPGQLVAAFDLSSRRVGWAVAQKSDGLVLKLGTWDLVRGYNPGEQHVGFRWVNFMRNLRALLEGNPGIALVAYELVRFNSKGLQATQAISAAKAIVDAFMCARGLPILPIPVQVWKEVVTGAPAAPKDEAAIAFFRQYPQFRGKGQDGIDAGCVAIAASDRYRKKR